MIDQRLRGLNFGGWFSQIDAVIEKDPETFPGIDKHIESFLLNKDIVRVKNAGFNHIRLPIDYQIFFSEQGTLVYENRFELLKQAVGQATRAGLMVILDLHECPGHDFHEGVKEAQSFFSHQEKREASKKVWLNLCRAFGENPLVLLEILNEPVAPSARVWNEVKQEMADFIRQNAPQSTIVVGSNLWNMPSTFSELTPLPDPNALYSFHFYVPLLFTHQRAPWIDDPNILVSREYPGEYQLGDLKDRRLESEIGYWDKARLLQSIEPVIRFRDKYKVAVACNEFGVFHQAPRESQLRWLNDFLSILKEHEIAYSYWNYKNLDFGVISFGEQLHQDLAQFKNSDRLDKEVLEVLKSY
ncbi:MAG: glycoside hydrolase family 5 protein [Spirochaetales bacterium]|nr:glycoside hydrolase family 5 protein [Spirochaetales bacterium]